MVETVEPAVPRSSDMEILEKKKKKKKSALSSGNLAKDISQDLDLQRSRVVLDMEAPKLTQSVHYSGAYMAMDVDNSLRLDSFKKNFCVDVKSMSDDSMEFDLINVDAAIANAFRRILIAEVPTMAIEKVFIANNTSVVQDEVLSHRLGLVPLRVDPRKFQYKNDGESASEDNTLVFRLHAKCTKQGGQIVGSKVLSGQLIWQPGGSSWPPESDKKFTGFSRLQGDAIDFDKALPRPHYDDIILSKMRPGQEIDLEAHAVKGMGKTHAKWSPVATATYRMLPEIHFLQSVEGDMADTLIRKCPVNVFDIEDLGQGKRVAKATHPRNCTLCRECIREDNWDKFIQLRRVKQHFIFTIESTGALPPDVLFTEAIKVLQDKATRISTELSTS